MSGQPSAHFNFARDVMERWAQLRPHELALWCVEEGGANDRRHTFADIADQFRRAANFFHESALVEHPAVVEAAVVAKPDAMRGAIVKAFVKAFVVLRRDRVASEELRRELQEHCKRVTAPYKYPREIEFLAELPKTISGKIRRVELRERG